MVRLGILDLEFAGHRRDPTTKVYAVEAFDFWANLTEARPALLHYEGPDNLIYNSSSKCVRGISILKNRFVNAVC